MHFNSWSLQGLEHEQNGRFHLSIRQGRVAPFGRHNTFAALETPDGIFYQAIPSFDGAACPIVWFTQNWGTCNAKVMTEKTVAAIDFPSQNRTIAGL